MMLFPCGLPPTAIAEVIKAGFRVIVPFRPGFFDAPEWRGRANSEEMLAVWSERCDALLTFLNFDRVHVASINYAAVWATDFARRYSERVQSMVMFSPPHPSSQWQTEARTASFLHSLAGIVKKAPWLSKPIAQLHAARVHDIDTCIKTLHKTYKNCPADLSVVESTAQQGLALAVPL
ncbi:alpha/beta fold hydrolase [Sulfitobacter aestuariivivens]|uniref:alpha/beta fold hydrolase n=1 Tax=Sulfitobacter aestuariivivens TaxID=2766981 RepID=UPI0036140FBD